MNTRTAFIESKRHYPILDGLRGVAAVIVVIFHMCEAFTFTNKYPQLIGHGYLAVDFFFLLSGFVIAYAYDDRWVKMSIVDFYKRRLVRLQPMVVMGSVIGAGLFYFQAGNLFPLVAITPVWKVLLLMVIGATLIPISIPMDIRGWQEMHPLDGPAWSLFFEYLANIMYAVLVRKFSKTLLSILVALSGCVMIGWLLLGPKGDLIGGWSLNAEQLFIGFTRVMYPFFAGVLLCRMGKLIKVKGAFWLCSLLVAVILCMPRIGDAKHVWMNGLFEVFCVMLVFPIIVSMGAGGDIQHARSAKICKFFGDISFPLYITHYPAIYVFTAWVTNHDIPLGARGLSIGLLLVVLPSILVAYACLKLYDEPVREWLRQKIWAKK